tara:strand:+ start:1043 stop:1330 length:288 start_codon:yes stop_codon:yes gene_type:complete
MAKEYTRIYLAYYDLIKNLETSKAYAVKYFNDVVFIPKSKSMLHELATYDVNKMDINQLKYCLEIDTWLITKSDKIKNLIKHYQDESKHKGFDDY